MHYPCRMIVLDEPFTGLDFAARRRAIAFIRRHQEGRTVLVATHGEEDAELLGARMLRLDEMQSS